MTRTAQNIPFVYLHLLLKSHIAIFPVENNLLEYRGSAFIINLTELNE